AHDAILPHADLGLPAGLSHRHPSKIVQLTHCTQRGEEDGQEREHLADRRDPQRLADPEVAAERAADQPAERHRAPDEEAHGGVHPAQQPLRRQPLAEADLGDVVDDRAEPEHGVPERRGPEQPATLGQRDAQPDRTGHGTVPSTTARPRSPVISTLRRRIRSTQAPAGSPTSRNAAVSQAASAPTSNGVARSASTATSGSASRLTWVPSWLTVSATKSC